MLDMSLYGKWKGGPPLSAHVKHITVCSINTDGDIKENRRHIFVDTLYINYEHIIYNLINKFIINIHLYYKNRAGVSEPYLKIWDKNLGQNWGQTDRAVYRVALQLKICLF